MAQFGATVKVGVIVAGEIVGLAGAGEGDNTMVASGRGTNVAVETVGEKEQPANTSTRNAASQAYRFIALSFPATLPLYNESDLPLIV